MPIARSFTVNYDIIPSTSKTSNAVTFNVASFTSIANLTGHTGFTASTQYFDTNSPQVWVQSALARIVVQKSGGVSGPTVRFRDLYYDGSNNPVWTNIADVSYVGPANPDNQAVDITATVAGWNWTPYRQVECQVIGNGILHQARLTFKYTMFDFTSEIADYQTRIAALEGAAALAGGGVLTEAQLQQITDNIRARLVS